MKIPHALWLVALMWLVHGAQTLFPLHLDSFGIVPRSMSGLLGLPLSPWLHGSWFHLIGNSIPFLILGALIQMKGKVIYWECTLIVMIIGGLGTWLIGSPAYHIGASGLVLGYWSFLIADAWFTRSIKAIMLAVITLAIYGGFVFILFDFRAHISWAGHISGIIAGIVVAKLYFNSNTKAALEGQV